MGPEWPVEEFDPMPDLTGAIVPHPTDAAAKPFRVEGLEPNLDLGVAGKRLG